MLMYSSRTVVNLWECGDSRELLWEVFLPQLYALMGKLDGV